MYVQRLAQLVSTSNKHIHTSRPYRKLSCLPRKVAVPATFARFNRPPIASPIVRLSVSLYFFLLFLLFCLLAWLYTHLWSLLSKSTSTTNSLSPLLSRVTVHLTPPPSRHRLSYPGSFRTTTTRKRRDETRLEQQRQRSSPPLLSYPSHHALG